MQKLTIRWAIPAYNDFLVYVDYYRKEAGLNISTKFAIAIENALDVLSHMPTVANPGVKINTRRYVVQKFPFIIEFRVRNGKIEILAFLHQSRVL